MDFDFYALTETCCQIDILKLFHGGFSTGHGFLREPQSIQSYAALAAIAIQANQNDQHGGQSIPNFDYGMAEGVAKSFARNYRQKLKEVIEDDMEFEPEEGSKDEGLEYAEAAIKHAEKETSEPLSLGNSDAFDKAVFQYLRKAEMFFDPDGMVARARKRAYQITDRETYQAMEGLVHNLNTMHCLPGSERIWVRHTETGEIGLISMQELNDTFQPGKYEALSVNMKTGETEFKAITASADQGSGRDLVMIRAKSGQMVRVTDNHKVLSVNKDTGEIFKDVPENIESVVIPRRISTSGKNIITISDYTDKVPRMDTPFQAEVLPLSDAFAYFLGVYAGDGSVVGGSTVAITCCSKIGFHDLSEITDKAFGMHVTYSIHNMPDGVSPKEICFNIGVYFCDALKKMCGRNAEEKRVPGFILSGSDSIKRAFLNGYNDTDGRHTVKYVDIGSVSRELISGTHYLMCALGELPSLCKPRVKTVGYKSYKPLFGVSLGCNAGKRVGLTTCGDVAFDLPKYDLSFVRNLVKTSKSIKKRHSDAVRLSELDAEVSRPENKHLEHLLNIFNVPIKEKLVSNSGEEHVFDISVADNENFVTEHMIAVSNSRAGAQV